MSQQPQQPSLRSQLLDQLVVLVNKYLADKTQRAVIDEAASVASAILALQFSFRGFHD